MEILGHYGEHNTPYYSLVTERGVTEIKGWEFEEKEEPLLTEKQAHISPSTGHHALSWGSFPRNVSLVLNRVLM